MFPSPNGKDGKLERVDTYCRVSSDEQAHASTIQNQLYEIQRCVEYCRLLIHDEYLDDGVSGTIPVDERP